MLAFDQNKDQVYTFKEDTVENANEETYSVDPYEEIRKVKELLDMGIITQEEFDTKKKELLGL